MNTYKYKCGHEIEREEVIHDTENVLCNNCQARLQKLKQKHIDSDIVTMSYFNYKQKYSTFDIEPGNYNVEKRQLMFLFLKKRFSRTI